MISGFRTSAPSLAEAGGGILGLNLCGLLEWKKFLLGQAAMGWAQALGTPCYTCSPSKAGGFKYLLPATCWLLVLSVLQTFPPPHTYTTYYGLHPDAHQQL